MFKTRRLEVGRQQLRCRPVPLIRYRRDEETFDHVFVYAHATATRCPARHPMSADPALETTEASEAAA